MSLRSKVIRLAYANPDLRGDLLPLIKETKVATEKVARGYKEVFSGDKIRVEKEGNNTLRVTEMPGKPVKRKVRQLRFTPAGNNGYYAPNSFLLPNILRDAKLTSSMSYDQAIAALIKATKKAREDAVKQMPEYAKLFEGRNTFAWARDENLGKKGWWNWSEEVISYLLVEPKDYKPIAFAGKDFSGTAQWQEFRFQPDEQDEYMQYNEGMSTFYKSKSAGGSRKLFKLLKANPDAVKGMTLRQFTDMLDKAKIAYTYVPTVWR